MGKEQRTFYRIDVVLPCSYRIISQEQADNTPLPTQPDARYIEDYFINNLGQLDEQINEIITHINQKSSILATALAAMNSKINFLLQTIDEKQLTKAIPQRAVNISGGGVSFDIIENISISDKVDLLLKPLPNEAPILVRCDVVKVIPQETGYTIALAYQDLSEEDRRKLIYFIQTKEIELAQKMRNAQK